MSNATTNNTCILFGTGCSSPTNLPSFIDNSACLCGLLNSLSTLPNNGEQIEIWRCMGDASADITKNSNGKWYNTSLPSQELSGIREPQDWGGNPPDLSQAYVLQDDNGHAAYQKLGPGGSANLLGADEYCTGKNSTSLSGQYYSRGKGASYSSSTPAKPASSTPSTSANSTASSGTTTSATPTTSQTSSTSSISLTTSSSPTSTKSSGPTSTASSSSAAPCHTLKSALLVGMMVAAVISLLL